MALRLYADLLSQPARALFIFMKMSKIPFEYCAVNLTAGEHLSEDFKKNYSPFQKVPFIHHGDFRLTESVAIMRYLTRTFPVEDYWYPQDSKKQASVDEFLQWFTTNMRLHCTSYFFLLYIRPHTTGKQPTQQQTQRLWKNLEVTLNNFEEFFLSDSCYIVQDTMTYGDLHAACEIEQLKTTDYDVEKNHPIIKAWIEKVRTNCKPHYEEAHKVIEDFGRNFKDLRGKL